MKFRPHSTAPDPEGVDLEPTLLALSHYIGIAPRTITIAPAVTDPRIFWDQHAVWIGGEVIAGYIDGPVVHLVTRVTKCNSCGAEWCFHGLGVKDNASVPFSRCGRCNYRHYPPR